jgi:hypothetical protein
VNRLVVILIVTLLGAASPGMPAAAQDRELTPEWVQRFEQSLDLNEMLKNDGAYDGHLSLEPYARYYETRVIDGVSLVHAVYVPPIERYPDDWTSCACRAETMTDCRPVTQPSEDVLRRHARGVHIGEPFPLHFDGGCDVITLSIEPETLQVVSARCNGLA